MPENGGAPKFLRLDMTVIPSGTGVFEGEAPQLGKGAILHLETEDGHVNVYLAPEDAIREGNNLVEMGKRLKSGLVIAGKAAVGPIAEAREQTDRMRGDGSRG